jgi:KRAB domain-containing zinc finger protein
VCHKTFVRKSDLMKHKQVHSEERPFSCDVCDKGFIVQKDLVKHKELHKGERPLSDDVVI